MDQITLLLMTAAPIKRWEDEVRGSWGVDQLREEFKNLLYADPPPIQRDEKYSTFGRTTYPG